MVSSKRGVKPAQNRENQCRFCLKPSRTRIKISRIMKNNFFEVTQLELLLSDHLSDFLCPNCAKLLRDAHSYRQQLIKTQKQLMDEIAILFKPEIVELKQEKLEIDDIIVTAELEDTICDTLNTNEMEQLKDFQMDLNLTETIAENLPLIVDPTTEINVKPKRIIVKREQKVQNFVCDHKNCKGRNFKTKRLYNEHIKTHKPISEYNVRPTKCSYCDKVLHSKRGAKKHMEAVHFKLRIFECDVCGYGTQTRAQIAKHMKKHLPVKDRPRFKCDLCDFESICLQTVKNHQLRDHSENPIDPEFDTKKPLIFRKLKHERTGSPKSNFKPTMCSYCGLVLCSKAGAQRHIHAIHLKLQSYFCDLCDYAAPTRMQIVSHLRRHLPLSVRKKYKCDLCDFEAYTRLTIKHHKLRDHEKVKFTCHCGKSFNNKQRLQSHKNFVHLKRKNFVCECGKSYYNGSDLSYHKLRVHSNDKSLNFACEVCGKQFGTKKQLRMHNYQHREAKFVCTYEGCDKSYTTAMRLRKHIKIHTGQKDFKCHLCDKAYYFNKNLQIHFDAVHRQTKFFCELCTHVNRRKDYLSRHIKSTHKHVSRDERLEMIRRVKFTEIQV